MAGRTFGIKFTQFLYPRGERRSTQIDLPDLDGEIGAAVMAIVHMGARMECEILEQTGLVSLTVTDPEHGDLYSELVPNGPQVPIAVERMVRRAAKDAKDGKWPTPPEDDDA